MKKNFVISDLIAFEGDDFYYDIHNCYSFNTIEFDKDNTQLNVLFEKVQGLWVKEKDPLFIKLQFNNVTYFRTSPDFFENAPKHIGEIGYKAKDDFDYDTFIPEKCSTELDDFILIFTNDDYIRVFADNIRVFT